MNMTPMRSVRQLFKHLISATKALVPTEDGAWSFLELLWSWFKGSEPQAGCFCTSFSLTIHHVGSVYFSRFPNCKAFHASAL